ncbi:calcium-binding protein [Seohaeicola nanhaiensis]|uniref:Calcium-binding protein n=1 Tax=Seohaeicola nanhaiensis TaxID=1387282 RepID=A0ABV9KEA4_9RHOB
MAAFVSLPSSGVFRLTDLFGVIDFITTEGTVGRFTTTFFGLSGTYKGMDLTVSVNGSGFGTGQINGETYVTSGTVTLIQVNYPGGNFQFRDLNIEMSSFSQIIAADESGAAPLGIENHLLGLGWEVHLGDLRDVGWINTQVGDGAAFNLTGNDKIYAGGGKDKIYAGDGNDTVLGGDGADVLNGGRGNDVLWGETGADVLVGGAGKDIFNGGTGNDRMTGGAAADKFVFYNNHGRDVITDFEATNNREKIDLSSVTEIVHFADLRKHHMTQVNDSVVIDDHAGTRITLLNTDIADLGSLDFIF